MPPPATSPPRFRPRSQTGQASVELVVLLPVVVAVLAVGYQAVLAGQALWETRVAAPAAAPAHAVGGDPAAAARTHLPTAVERGVRVAASGEGDVRVSVRLPPLLEAGRRRGGSPTPPLPP